MPGVTYFLRPSLESANRPPNSDRSMYLSSPRNFTTASRRPVELAGVLRRSNGSCVPSWLFWLNVTTLPWALTR